MNKEEQEIRAMQWSLWKDTFLVVLRHALIHNPTDWEDKCYDAAAHAEEAVVLFNDSFSGRGIGTSVAKDRRMQRRDYKYNSIYDRAMKVKE